MYLKMSQLLKFEVLVNKEGHGSQILIKFKYILIEDSFVFEKNNDTYSVSWLLSHL